MNIRFSQKHKEQFRKMGILAIYLFGSHAAGKTHALDIGVAFENPEKYRGNTLEVYSALYKIFVELLPKEYLRKRFLVREHEFDIVFLQFTPIVLQFDAITQGKILYEKDRTKRLLYHEHVIRRYLDTRHFAYMRHEAILARI